MTGYSDVKQILDAAVGGPGAAVGGPHGPFWRSRTRDQFVSFSIFGLPVVTLGDGDGSTIVKALRGQAPFGQDTGTPGASFRRMPAGRPPVPPEQIAVIADWITNGAPEIAQPPLGPLEIRLEGSASGQAFLIVSDDVHAATAQLNVRTTDGSEGDVSLRVRAGSGATISLGSATMHVSGTASAVSVVATSASAAPNDTAIEILQGPTVLAQFELTVVAAASLRFSGRFQCRLATDPDDYDDPWGHQSSFGVYAVQGPDPANPDEPPLDRIVRFHDAVAVRPFCGPVGVLTVAVEAQVGGQTLRFTDGDASIGQSVRLGPECVFDSRNRTFAPDGFEPIANFRLEIGDVFSGASAPAVPRSDPNDPPGSTAPYAAGILVPDRDPTGWRPSDFGYPESTWAERSWATVASKLARLVAQPPADARESRIRDRRIQEHSVQRLAAIGFPIQLMESYSGLIDRQITVASGSGRIMAYLASLPAITFQADFLDFDTDCRTGTVTGTLGAPPADGGRQALLEPAPTHAMLGRRAPLDEQAPVPPTMTE